MSYDELSTSLSQCAGLLQDEQIAEIDFARLADQLTAAAQLLQRAKQDREIATEMLANYRTELRRHARATARLTGSDPKLIERLIGSEELTFSDLVELRRQIESEFDDAFSSTLTEPPPVARGDERFANFKS